MFKLPVYGLYIFNLMSKYFGKSELKIRIFNFLTYNLFYIKKRNNQPT